MAWWPAGKSTSNRGVFATQTSIWFGILPAMFDYYLKVHVNILNLAKYFLRHIFWHSICLSGILSGIYFDIPSGIQKKTWHLGLLIPHLVICYIAMERSTMLLIGKPSISMGHLYHGYVTNNQRIFIFAQSPDKSVVKKNGPFWGKGKHFWWQYRNTRKSNSSAGQKSRKSKIG